MRGGRTDGLSYIDLNGQNKELLVLIKKILFGVCLLCLFYLTNLIDPLYFFKAHSLKFSFIF